MLELDYFVFLLSLFSLDGVQCCLHVPADQVAVEIAHPFRISRRRVHHYCSSFGLCELVRVLRPPLAVVLRKGKVSEDHFAFRVFDALVALNFSQRLR